MESTVAPTVAAGFILGFLGYMLFNRKNVKFLPSNNYKFVMAVRTDILLTKSETTIYCSRATLECYKRTKFKYPEAVNLWVKNNQPKIVLKLGKNGNEEIWNLQSKAESVGLVAVAVKEESKSQSQNNFIVIGIGPGPEEIVNEVTGHLKLL